MILMNKVEITAYRYLGCVGACFTLFQSGIWLLLAFVGAICKFTGCGSGGSKRTFKYCFYLMYYYEPQNSTANFTRVNYISPTIFQGIMWFNALLCVANIVISVFTAKAFIEFKDPKLIKRMACIWTRCILVFSACELIMFIIFASDVVSIKQKEDVKCFLKINLTLLQSISSERAPAPYLLQLKSNLKTMKKKIRKYKKKLLLLDAVFDEKSPEHMENPFISKDVVNSYVEDIWKSMFNNSIREKVRRKADAMPLDETMRHFVISEHLDLDDMDSDLLKNFDGLTNNKWIKLIQSSNVVVGRQYNLSSSVATDDSAELDKITSLLHEYLEGANVPTTTSNNSQPEQSFDDLFNEILDELEEQETNFVYNKDELNDMLGKIDLFNQNASLAEMDNDEVLLSVKKFLDGMAPQDGKEQETKEFDDLSMQRVINKVKDFLENNQTEESDYENFGNTTGLLTNQYADYDFGHLGDRDNASKKILNYNGSRSFDEEFKTSKNGKGKKNIRKNKLKWRKDEYDDDYDDEDEYEAPAPKPKPKPPPPKPAPPKAPVTVAPTETEYGNDLVKELCENCVYFILGPSIVCMILSLKTGLVWVLNITVAVLVIYYGSRIQLKKRFRFSPCLHKKK